MIEREDVRLTDPHVGGTNGSTSEDTATDDVVQFENKLRPQTFEDYIGQAELKRTLLVSISAAQQRSEPLEHVLLHGSAGLGKTTLAHIIAHAMGSTVRITSGPALERAADVASILTNLKAGDVFFIDEIHRLRPAVEEVLYSAMEDFAIDITLGKGPSARAVRLNLPHFTLVGATTKISLLSSPLRDRFGNVCKFSFYSKPDIQKIITRSANILNISIDPIAAELLAACSRATPRIANRLLRRVRDFAQYHGETAINEQRVKKTMDELGVDPSGLDRTDRDILRTIIEKFSGGPVGLNTISSALSEEEATIEDIYEPYLIQLGLLERTSRGRMVTQHAFTHLGLPLPATFRQNTLIT
ncbi:Holliday junction branch migration DNA helicase RuvB [Candidatus Gracilibacteria bacterium]|nr:Holliday junction branch migration DNA helicase RuvB [Candidatus Gracilibacteria bacterium]